MAFEVTKGQFEEFEGVVEDVKLEPTNLKGEEGEQYHIIIKPTNVEIKGKTGMMHEWIRVTAKATDESVPEGSVLHRFLTELWTVDKETKSMGTHTEMFNALRGKKFKWVKKTLGKSFDGHDAKEYWCPQAKLEA